MERPWLSHYDPGVPATVSYPNWTLVDLLREAVETCPQKPAIDFYGKVLTYERLWQMVEDCALSFFRDGVEGGDRVMLFLPTVPQFVVCYYAALLIGAVPVLVYPLIEVDQLAELIASARPKILVGLDLKMPRIDSLLKRVDLKKIYVTSTDQCLPLIVRPGYWWKYREEIKTWKALPGKSRFSNLPFSGESLPGRKNIIYNLEPAPDDLAVLVYTSGTAGKQKGVALTHRNLVANTLQCLHWIPGLRYEDEVFLGILPLFHVYGMTVAMNLAIALKAKNVLMAQYDVGVLASLLLKNNVTFLPAVARIYADLVASQAKKLERLKTLKVCTSGADSLPALVRDQFYQLTGLLIGEGYGLSEASPVTHNNPLIRRQKTGSVGLPFPDTDARIVDPQSPEKDLPVGKVGELLVRGPQVMSGYWDDSQATDEVFAGDGWLRTGDLMKMDEDGFFYFVARSDNLIKVNGLKVYPAEVERVIEKHPAVEEAAVVGVPDDLWGQIVKAFVKPRTGAKVHTDEIISWCHNKLPGHKVPKQVSFIDRLPKNLLGKVIKRELK